ncbi:MAG: XRE family transcriptional regulator [Clostridia bacterium]|nr:XRE family transcriptional regulator [Clostridia bacterium]
MEFNEKLQELRKNKELTQEELASQLFVSRAAISKWESGKGYPNIESLKLISKFFSVSIDELLSGDELITLAEKENKSNIQGMYDVLIGVMDIMAIILIVLPLYGNPIEGYIYSVNLISFSATTPLNLLIYWVIYISLIVIGIMKLLFIHFQKAVGENRITKISVGLSIVSMIFLIAAREPYATTLVFLFLVVKVVLLLKKAKIK